MRRSGALRSVTALLSLLLVAASAAACTAGGEDGEPTTGPSAEADAPGQDDRPGDSESDPGGDAGGDPEATAGEGETAAPAVRKPRGTVTLAFAGDLHFELHLRDLLGQGRDALGPITSTLRSADLAMVNLESSITDRGTPEPKDYHFRTSPEALDLLDAAGVDVVTMANNHAVDYGEVGLRDTVRAVNNSPVPVVGIGADAKAAYRPHIATVGETKVAFLGANARRERTVAAWPARADRAGIATAGRASPPQLIAAVEAAAEAADVVVVYLHWGTELEPCPGWKQQTLARNLADAGADVIVGSHAHVVQGGGWLEDTYVGYGLGNFVWYHNSQAVTGVLELRVSNGDVVKDDWQPALIDTSGLPIPVDGASAMGAISSWRALRDCTGLDPAPPIRATG